MHAVKPSSDSGPRYRDTVLLLYILYSGQIMGPGLYIVFAVLQNIKTSVNLCMLHIQHYLSMYAHACSIIVQSRCSACNEHSLVVMFTS